MNRYSADKIIDPRDVGGLAEAIKSSGRTLVTLNGSFDLLHAGHLHIIYEASLQGDVLLVALNSDDSIRKYKSPKRPIISLENRMEMMAALGFVSYVTWFDETDPIHLIETVKPHVHVNGADWGSECIESEAVHRVGGKLVIVPLVPGLSTSAIIEKIKSL